MKKRIRILRGIPARGMPFFVQFEGKKVLFGGEGIVREKVP